MDNGIHRVNDLIKQVPGLRYDCSVGTFETDRKALYDFAELIAKEHQQVLQHLWYEYNNAPQSSDETPRDIGFRVGQKAALISAIERIRQHFGVQ